MTKIKFAPAGVITALSILLTVPFTASQSLADDTPLPRPNPERAATAAPDATTDADNGADDKVTADASATDDDTAEQDVAEAAGDAIPLPRPRPDDVVIQRAPEPWSLSPAASPEVAEETRVALNHLMADRFDQALTAQRELGDPLAAKLIEFFYVRDASVRAPHHRIAAFLRDNPGWPSQGLIRRRLEVALLSQRASAEAVFEELGDAEPMTNPGKIALATALKETGEAERATETVRDLWRNGRLTEGEEKLIRQRFGDMLRKEDHKYRMDRLLYAGDRTAGLRIARELGGAELKLAEARIAVTRGASNAGDALGAVPEAKRSDPLYMLSRIQHTRRSGKDIEAARMLLATSANAGDLVDPDAWAVERRIAARELVEAGDARAAYDVMRVHSARSDLERMDSDWHAGWIALSFLDDPAAARRHFADLRSVASRPISVARAEYWLGRTAEASGDYELSSQHFRLAAEHPTTYYGQLALDRITREGIAPPQKPIEAAAARRLVQEREPVRAIRLLVQMGHERLAAGLLMAMAEEAEDSLTAIGVAEIASAMKVPAATVHIGKQGVYAGYSTELYAFTDDGIPGFPRVGAPIEPALVYAIARQESLFNTEAESPAGALGLMQIMPRTARATAQAHGLSYSQDRLTSDPVYNATLGAAHLGELIREFGDAYALVFAAYNAGSSRVHQWIERFGDPRLGEIDPVDWVELIPFTETRNYVQRVMEGLQVYRASLEGEAPLRIAQDMRIPDARRALLAINETDSPFEMILGDVAPEPEPSTPSSLGFAPGTASMNYGGIGGFGGFGGASGFGFGGN